MNSTIIENLNTLYTEQKLNKSIIIWGIGHQTDELINGLTELNISKNI